MHQDSTYQFKCIYCVVTCAMQCTLKSWGSEATPSIMIHSFKRSYTTIPYRASTGPEQGFHCVVFPHREKPVFITGIPANENRFFPCVEILHRENPVLALYWPCKGLQRKKDCWVLMVHAHGVSSNQFWGMNPRFFETFCQFSTIFDNLFISVGSNRVNFFYTKNLGEGLPSLLGLFWKNALTRWKQQ